MQCVSAMCCDVRRRMQCVSTMCCDMRRGMQCVSTMCCAACGDALQCVSTLFREVSGPWRVFRQGPQELKQRGVELFRFLHVHHVPGLVDDAAFAAGKAGGQELHGMGRGGAVESAGYD